MSEFDKLTRILGFSDLKKRNRDRNHTTARQAICFYFKQKGYHEKEIAKMCDRSRSNVIYSIKMFNNLLSVRDSLSVYYWSKIKDN